MIYVKETLAYTARNILNAKSTVDDVQALDDVIEIENIISDLKKSPHSFELKAYARNLDIKLKSKYKTIALFQNAIETFKRTPTYSLNSNEKSYEPEEVSLLRCDEFGIFAETLLKHKIITSVELFIDRIESDSV